MKRQDQDSGQKIGPGLRSEDTTRTCTKTKQRTNGRIQLSPSNLLRIMGKILISNQSLSMRPLQVDRALLGGLEFGFREILANGAGQKKF